MNRVVTGIWKKNAKNKRFITWKDMDEGDYKISNEGHIMSLRGVKKIIKHRNPDCEGRSVAIYKNGACNILKIKDLIKKYFKSQENGTH